MIKEVNSANPVDRLPTLSSLDDLKAFVDSLSVGEHIYIGQSAAACGSFGLPNTNHFFRATVQNSDTKYLHAVPFNMNQPDSRIKKYGGTWDSAWSRLGIPVDMSTRTSLIPFGIYKTAGEVITLNTSKNNFIYLLAHIGNSTNGITLIPILGSGWGTTSDKFALTNDNESLIISFPSATSMKIEAVSRASSGLRQLYGVGLKIE